MMSFSRLILCACALCMGHALKISSYVQNQPHALKVSSYVKSSSKGQNHMEERPGASCDFRETAEQNALAKLQERQAFLNSDLREQTPVDWNSALLLQPYYPCFGTLEKTTSAHEQWDGGKWICGLKEMSAARPKMVVYSLGSGFETSFEDRISNKTGNAAEIHIYDPTMAQDKNGLNLWVSKLKPNQNFHDMGIRGLNENPIKRVNPPFPAITLKEALANNGHSGIDILKFDIEGYEKELLESVDWSTVKIGIVAFELHANIIKERENRYTFLNLQEELARMESAGYRMYSAEPVCPQCIGQVELAMVHRDWDPTYGFSGPCKSK